MSILIENRSASGDKRKDRFRPKLAWVNIIFFIILHLFVIEGFRRMTVERPWKTVLWVVFLIHLSGLGVTAGMHRLWSHKTYKAKMPLQILLAIVSTMAGQNSILIWSRDHRVHHKFAETDADPHNIKRGFFFAHMGWLLQEKHPDVKSKGSSIDMSDLKASKLIMLQYKYFYYLAVLFVIIIPTMIPVVLWGEKLSTSFLLSFALRYCISLHSTWLINSAAHTFGTRPYDKNMEAREKPVELILLIGEGFHNYHHAFPQDYRASEFGRYLNITTAFLDFCAVLGLAYDLKSVSKEVIEKRKIRTGE